MYPKKEDIPAEVIETLEDAFGENLRDLHPILLLDLWTTVRCMSLKMPLRETHCPPELFSVLEYIEGANFRDLNLLFHWIEGIVKDRPDMSDQMIEDLG